jgi:hypothetical protein
MVTVVTGQGRMFPLYYALVGWPSLVNVHRLGWLLMRLANAVLCAALLASSAVILMSWSRRPLVTGSVMFVALTPLALNLTGAVNPSGLEAVSALCFLVTLTSLLHGRVALGPRVLLGLGAVSGVLLATARQLGWIWVLVFVVFSLSTAKRSLWRAFLWSRQSAIVLGSTGVAIVLEEAWAVRFHSDQVFVYTNLPKSLGRAALASLKEQPLFLKQTLADFGWLRIPPSGLVEICWIVALVAVIFVAISTSTRAAVVTTAGLAAVFLVPFAVQTYALAHPKFGEWQGRYTLPLAVAAPLLAVACERVPHRMARFDGVAAAIALLAVVCGQIAVTWGVWPHAVWYSKLGITLLVLGAAGLVTNLLWNDVRWRRTRLRTDHRIAESRTDEPRHPPDDALRGALAEERPA